MAVVVHHDAVTFAKGVVMMKRGLALFGIAGHCLVHIDERQTASAGFFHDPDTPIDVGRIAIAEIVWDFMGNVRPGVESLMEIGRASCRERV